MNTQRNVLHVQDLPVAPIQWAIATTLSALELRHLTVREQEEVVKGLACWFNRL